MNFRYKKTKNKFTLLALLVVAVFSIPLISANVIAESIGKGIKSSNSPVLEVAGAPRILELKDNESERTYTSPAFEADHAFNAIAPHWQEELKDGEHRSIDIRVSTNGQDWTDWMEIEVERPMRNDTTSQSRIGAEAPLFIEGRYFQYRVDLLRDPDTKASPRIADLKINYIDSRETLTQSLINSAKTFGMKVFASGMEPTVISRAGWDSPDPNGDLFKGTDKYWEPQYVETEQTFLHHTATSNNHSNPKEVVRAIWDYHANTLGWGDIGYNYILDRNGNIYQGRFGGDHVVAGHVRNYNKGSMGVAVLGCFQPSSSTCNELNDGNTTGPTSATINGLTNLVAWKHASFGINPTITHPFCDSNGNNCKVIPTIAAHRDAYGHDTTECNGKLFYDKSAEIRKKVKNKIINNIPHPNGTLIQETGKPQVFLIEGGQRRHILNKHVFTSHGYSWGKIRVATRADLQLLSGEPLNFRAGSLIKGSGNPVYVVNYVNGQIRKRHISSLATFNGLGYSFSEVLNVSDSQLPTADGQQISSTDIHPNGTLVQPPDNHGVFQIDNGQLRHVMSRPVFDSHGYRWIGVKEATPEDTGMPAGDPINFRSGTLIRGSGSPVYVVDYQNGTIHKRQFASRMVFEGLGNSFTEVLGINDSQLPALDGEPVDMVAD